MPLDFLGRLGHEIIIGDGAMGTYIYAKGVPLNRCYDELNLINPHLIRFIHREYIQAGAEFIETNTFTANRLRLRRFGLEEKTREINCLGAQIARGVAKDSAYVAGSVGPLTGAKLEQEITHQEKYDMFAEQMLALAEGGCDVLILETFTDLGELLLALKVAKEKTDLPVICQMTFTEKGKTPLGVGVLQALSELEKGGADVIGVNCAGPMVVLKVLQQMGTATHARLSAFPNAGLPEYIDGRYMYLSTPEYIAGTAKRLVHAGANLVGGCCGTTPQDIKAIVSKLKHARPVPRRILIKPQLEVIERVQVVEVPPRPSFIDKIGDRCVVAVELDPPKGLNHQRVVQGAVRLQEAGADVITVGDNPLAVMRMGNLAVAHLMEREGIQTILHLCCRDRNLIGLQSAVLEAAALGITSILAVTGDPAKVGDQPGATSVYDMNSLDLIHLINQMNSGKDHAGNPIHHPTRFSIGCAFNPNVEDIDAQIKRLVKKVKAGANYALSQPMYDIARIGQVYDALRSAVGEFPVFFGVMPVVSARNAEFLHFEVPGIRIPETVLRRMRQTPQQEQQDEGIKIAKELIDVGIQHAPGIYIIPPFGKISLAQQLVEYVRLRSSQRLRVTSNSDDGMARWG
jgi:homocysteine S-methyltransferase